MGTKLSLLVAPDALAQIDELVVKTGEASRTAVISRALQMYDGLITEVDKGTVFYTRQPDGTFVEYRLFLT